MPRNRNWAFGQQCEAAMRRALVTYDAGLPNGARRSKLPHELRALSPELAHLSDSRIYHYFHRVRG